MIIKGKIIEFYDEQILIMTKNDVGFHISVPNIMIFEKDKEYLLYTKLVVKEEGINLVGFNTKTELACFNLLTEVSGIGPKTALGILKKGNLNELISAIRFNDINYFKICLNLNENLASLICAKLKRKICKITYDDSLGKEKNNVLDTIIALKSIGYSDASINVVKGKLNPLLSIEENFKTAIKELKNVD